MQDLLREQLRVHASLSETEMMAGQAGTIRNKTLKRITSNPLTSPIQNQSLLVAYVSWYIDSVRDRATLGSVIACTLKKSILSSQSSRVKLHEYTDRSGKMAI
jgi:hypothetical protein